MQRFKSKFKCKGIKALRQEVSIFNLLSYKKKKKKVEVLFIGTLVNDNIYDVGV